ncbi:hypothetical protein D9M71_479310 [compost metagenome]
MGETNYVEGAQQINIHHRFEGVAGHLGRSREEVASSARNQYIDGAEGFHGLSERGVERFRISHVGGQPQGLRTQFRGGCHGFFLIAPQHGNFGTVLGKSFGDAQVNTTGATGDENMKIRETRPRVRLIHFLIAFIQVQALQPGRRGCGK